MRAYLGVERFNPNKMRQSGASGQPMFGLYLAAQGGHLGVGNLLLADSRTKVDLQLDDSSGVTALVVASQLGLTDIVEALLKHGADPETQVTDNATSLIVAAQRGHSGTMRMLLDYGADVQARTSDGATALLFAAQNARNAAAEVLLEKDADISLPWRFNLLFHKTPLRVAQTRKWTEFVFNWRDRSRHRAYNPVIRQLSQRKRELKAQRRLSRRAGVVVKNVRMGDTANEPAADMAIPMRQLNITSK